MFHDFLTVNNFFRVLNFSVFCTLVAYLFKTYLLPSIRQQIQEKKLLLHNLEQQKQGIKNQLSNIEQALQQQQHIAYEITKKIEQWNGYVALQKKEKIAEASRIQEHIKKNLAIKSNQIALNSIKKTEIPSLLATLEQELSQTFSNKEDNEHYIHDIITFIKKSTS